MAADRPKRRVYIAGPMTGYPNSNIAAFDAARDQLRSEGIEAISPVDISRAMGVTDFSCALTEDEYCKCLLADFRALLGADAVYTLPGWPHSRGARSEVLTAQTAGIPILDFESRLPVRLRVVTAVEAPQ